ncbi:MAG: DUF3102 domain-containing protein [Oscillospiraceae bacterium]|nr:DUF3102 domain-containing protein [Oscillospiraceae bacterium]
MKSIDRDVLSSRLVGGGLAGEAMEHMAEAVPAGGRTLEVIGAEIREHTAALEYHARATIWEAVEIGRRLAEAKDLCRHGEWEGFISKETAFTARHANNLIRVFEGYGAEQKSLFGPELANRKTFSDLSFSKALALLSIEDEGEREEFALVHDVESMSTRELKEAIRQRDEARQKAVRWEEQAGSYASELNDAQNELRELGSKLQEAENQEVQLRADMEALEQQKRKAEQEAAEAGAKLSGAKAESETLRQTVKELESRPVDVAVMSVDQEAIDKAKAEAVAEIQERLDKAKAKAERAEEKRKAAEDALAEANEKLEAARRAEAQASIAGDKELANFEMLFSQTQEKVNVMHGVLLKVRGRGDSDLVGKLQKALLALSEAVRRCAE